RAIELDPTFAQAYFNIGALLGNQGLLQEALPYFERAAQLGESTGAQYAAQVRQMLGEAAPEAQVDPTQAALEAFAQAQSAAEMQQVAARYPFLLEPDFVSGLEQLIAQQVPPEHHPHFKQRLDWLKQIAAEQQKGNP
ncbi:MAG: tetratricopeptide repeat protein, partial [Anaerolineae bacterium]|nr:tetratricopeptide repeat protein [Anaerolineae bacterium]